MLFIREKSGDYRQAKPIEVLKAAKSVAARKYLRKGDVSSPDKVREFLQYALKGLDSECFCVLFLDNQHRVIQFSEMFFGTIDAASVYPRDVVKKALDINAASVIFAHNHPSGVCEPSQADKIITEKLVDCLKLFSIDVLDHFIVGDSVPFSFAENGLLIK